MQTEGGLNEVERAPLLAPTRLLLVRHGESMANVEGRMQGLGNDPLSPQGRAQSQRLAAWLGEQKSEIAALFASPLQRARETASLLAERLGLEVQPYPGLEEIGLGDLEESSVEVLEAALKAGNIALSHRAEDPKDFVARVVASISEIVNLHRGQTVVVVTHLGTICMALAHWQGQDISRAWELHGDDLRNTAISELSFGEEVVLIRHNYAPHLD